MSLRVIRLAVAVLALVASAGVAGAQAQPQPPAPQPSQSHLDAARAVVVGSGMVRSFEAILPQIIQRIRDTLITRPEMAKDLEDVVQKTTPTFVRAKDQMIDVAARIYATQMSEDDLKAIAAFYASPAGKHFVETQPSVLDQMFNEMQAWTETLSSVVIQRVRAEMKARGHEF